MGQIEVYPAVAIPSNSEVLDAEADGLLDSQPLKKALIKASQTDVSWNTDTTDTTEATRDSVDNTSPDRAPNTDGTPDDGAVDVPDGPRLASIESEAMASTDEVETKIGFRDNTYVRYENRTYTLFYSETVC